MKNPYKISPAFRAKARYCLSFIAPSAAAFLILGPVGGLVSALFAPLFAAALFQNATSKRDAPAGPDNRDFIMGWLSRFLGQIDHPTIAMVIEIDDFQKLEEVYDSETLQSALSFAHSVIEENLTAKDVTIHLDRARFISALAPQGPHKTEAMLNTCTRIQHALGEAAQVTDLPVHLTASIGFVSSNKLIRPTAEKLIQAALTALAEAKIQSPNAVRAFSEAIAKRRSSQRKLVVDATKAFPRGEIFAYFQPQLDLEDGRLSGFEALARWHHPEKGIMSPLEFLAALEQANLMPQLGETMIQQALQALTFWDKNGLNVPRVGVNLSTSELRNPRLVDRISKHLEVGNIAPDRLSIEVLETVIATDQDDDIIGNLAALSDLGCGVDLDDFGTGYASISNIRKFSVKRIKIDRSFITGVESDEEQSNMVAAILMMAERLGVTTFAEGVETRAEREALHALGCRDIQGFQVARPMPIQETVEWANAYFAQTAQPIQFTKRAS